MADETTTMQRAKGAGAVRMAAGPRIDEGDTWDFPAEEATRLDPTQWKPAKQKAQRQPPDPAPATTLTMPADPAVTTEEVTDGTANRAES